MVVIVMAVLGLVMGSFINALVDRLHSGKDWVKGRSECPKCHHKLGPKDLVPVFSWLSLGGRCRYCHKPIPDSPLVELAVGAIFALSYVMWPFAFSGVALAQFIIWLVLVVIFVALAVYDLRWLILPDKLVFPAISLSLLQVLITYFKYGSLTDLIFALLSAAMLSGLFLAIYVTSKGKWIGFGDVKLAIALGLLAGGPVMAMLILFIASLAGILFALPAVLKGKATGQTKLPFGTLLVFGLIVVQLFGDLMVSRYLDLLTF